MAIRPFVSLQINIVKAKKGTKSHFARKKFIYYLSTFFSCIYFFEVVILENWSNFSTEILFSWLSCGCWQNENFSCQLL